LGIDEVACAMRPLGQGETETMTLATFRFSHSTASPMVTNTRRIRKAPSGASPGKATSQRRRNEDAARKSKEDSLSEFSSTSEEEQEDDVEETPHSTTNTGAQSNFSLPTHTTSGRGSDEGGPLSTSLRPADSIEVSLKPQQHLTAFLNKLYKYAYTLVTLIRSMVNDRSTNDLIRWTNDGLNFIGTFAS
jgi:hypothetical protein